MGMQAEADAAQLRRLRRRRLRPPSAACRLRTAQTAAVRGDTDSDPTPGLARDFTNIDLGCTDEGAASSGVD